MAAHHGSHMLFGKAYGATNTPAQSENWKPSYL